MYPHIQHMTQKAYIKPTTLTMSVRQDTALLGLSKIQVDTDGNEKGNAWEEAASKDNQTETDDLWDE